MFFSKRPSIHLPSLSVRTVKPSAPTTMTSPIGLNGPSITLLTASTSARCCSELSHIVHLPHGPLRQCDTEPTMKEHFLVDKYIMASSTLEATKTRGIRCPTEQDQQDDNHHNAWIGSFSSEGKYWISLFGKPTPRRNGRGTRVEV